MTEASWTKTTTVRIDEGKSDDCQQHAGRKWPRHGPFW